MTTDSQKTTVRKKHPVLIGDELDYAVTSGEGISTLSDFIYKEKVRCFQPGRVKVNSSSDASSSFCFLCEVLLVFCVATTTPRWRVLVTIGSLGNVSDWSHFPYSTSSGSKARYSSRHDQMVEKEETCRSRGKEHSDERQCSQKRHNFQWISTRLT